MVKFVVPMLIMFFVAGSANGQKQSRNDPESRTTKPKLAEVYVDHASSPTYISVDGIWEPDNPTKQNELVPGVINLKCYHHGGQEFVSSESFCLVATATPIVGTINVTIDWLRVVEWSDSEIIVVDDSSDCILSQTTFDLTSRTVTGLDIRKANSKLDLCKKLPERQTYYLRDKLDYELNHEPVKK